MKILLHFHNTCDFIVQHIMLYSKILKSDTLILKQVARLITCVLLY